MTEDVALEIAQPHDAPLLANLIELYVDDRSEVFAVEVGPGRRFGYDRLPRYWTEPELRFRSYTGGAMIETHRPGTPHPWTVFEFDAPGGAGR